MRGPQNPPSGHKRGPQKLPWDPKTPLRTHEGTPKPPSGHKRGPQKPPWDPKTPLRTHEGTPTPPWATQEDPKTLSDPLWTHRVTPKTPSSSTWGVAGPDPGVWGGRIKEGSVIDRIPVIGVGDMIEAIDGRSLVGARHFEVAKLLKELPKGRPFALRLTEPRKAFGEPLTGSTGSGGTQLGTGRGTLRLRARGPATVEEQPSAFEERAIAKVDDLLESYMGIRDTELAATMVELGRDARDPDALAQALDSQLGDFAFPDEFVFDVWGAIGDAKVGRC
uniref:GIPC PDZ domain containing family member 1 n=1 Tax=Anas platyrhynchos TaxID=8839 RepID=A0A8B9T911_ANAPL